MTEPLLKENTFNSQQELIITQKKLRKARENADDRIVIGLSFSADWTGGDCGATFLDSESQPKVKYNR